MSTTTQPDPASTAIDAGPGRRAAAQVEGPNPDDFSALAGWLGLFYPGPHEPIHLRAFPPPGGKGQPKKILVTRARLATDKALQARLGRLNLTHGLYFVVNTGGNSDKDITRFNAFFCERDEGPIAEQHAMLDAAPLRPSIRVVTSKSVHAYWLAAGEVTREEWEEIQRRLISYFSGDPAIKNASRVMRLPFFNHVAIDGLGWLVYKRVEVVEP
ncbi:MAG: hypothetical protein HY650_16665 [Acidobacteria bacterium]|nr:hypothetical protein [Acidobacteriota bacterium]